MGVQFFGSIDSPNWVYTPEKTADSHVNMIKDIAKINKETDGYVSKKRELRLEAKIPLSVEYNWCMNKGIPVHKHSAYMTKHYRELLAEFPVFQIVEKI